MSFNFVPIVVPTYTALFFRWFTFMESYGIFANADFVLILKDSGRLQPLMGTTAAAFDPLCRTTHQSTVRDMAIPC
jgi:hypothetical protein